MLDQQPSILLVLNKPWIATCVGAKLLHAKVSINKRIHEESIVLLWSRHGGNSKNDCLRNWTLQGSYDGKTWEIISRHVNDTSLNAPFATYTTILSMNGMKL